MSDGPVITNFDDHHGHFSMAVTHHLPIRYGDVASGTDWGNGTLEMSRCLLTPREAVALAHALEWWAARQDASEVTDTEPLDDYDGDLLSLASDGGDVA